MQLKRIIPLVLFISLIFSQDVNIQLSGVYADSVLLNNVEISISSSSEIGGFQFQTTGGVLESAFDGLADEAGFTTSISADGIVLSFSFTGQTISVGDGILINLDYSSFTNPELCITAPVFSDPLGVSMDVDVGECIPTGVLPTTPTLTILNPLEGESLSQNFIDVSISNSEPDAGYHYHAYINANMEGMYYNENFQIIDLPWGIHELIVVLADSLHIECTDTNCSDTVSFILNQPVPEFATLSIGDINPNEQTIEINMQNSGEVGGVQFNVTGVNVIEMFGGSADEYGFTNQTMNNVVLSFTLTGNWIQSGEGLFTTLSFDEVFDEQLCILNAIVSNEWGDEIPVTISDCIEIPEPMNEYYIVDLEQTGVNQLIEFSPSIMSLEVGDEIGVFDLQGVIETTNECEQIQTGEILVGSGIWSTSGVSIIASGSANTCELGGYATAGFNLGNPLVIRIYRPENEMEYETNISVSMGSESFSELFSIIDEINLIDSDNQLPVAVLSENEFQVVRGENFTLDGSGSYDNDGTIVSYEWFLNGIDLIADDTILNYSFNSIGAYTVYLIVTDNSGAIGSAIAEILVINQEPDTFNLLTPGNNEIITVNNSIEFETILINYSWEASIDGDNDSLFYLLEIWNSNMGLLLDTIISDLDYSIPVNWGGFEIGIGQESSFDWKVIVSDGYDDVESPEWSFIIDATNLDLENSFINQFALMQNFPNPFNPITEINFSLKNSEWIELSIYDLMGRKINTLVNNKMNVGNHAINWDGKNHFGRDVPAGLYIYRLTSSDDAIYKSMLLIK